MQNVVAFRGDLYCVYPVWEGVFFTRSQDGGQSWSTPLHLSGKFGSAVQHWRAAIRDWRLAIRPAHPGVSFRAAATARNPLPLARVGHVGRGFFAVAAAQNDTRAELPLIANRQSLIATVAILPPWLAHAFSS